MSRAQEGDVVSAAKGQNKTYYNNAQNSYANAQADVGGYEQELADYKGKVAGFDAKNPYVQGGEFQKGTNQILADTSDASSRAAGQVLQSQALRTGNNSAGAIAATEEMERQGTRDLGADQARANQQRIQGEAGYDKEALGADQTVLGASAVPEQMEASLSHDQGALGEGTLGTEEKGAEMKSWTDQFGDELGAGLAKLATGGTKA